MNPCDPMAETHTASTNDGFIVRWLKLSGCRNVQIFGRLHTVLCNVPLFMLPGVQLQIKLTKAQPIFYLMNKTADSKSTLKFLHPYPTVKRVQLNPLTLSAHDKALTKWALALYNITRVTSRLTF